MIRASIICPDPGLSAQLQEALTGFCNVGVEKVLHYYPDEIKLPIFLKAAIPELIFLSIESVSDAADVAQRIDAESTGTPVIAIGHIYDATAVVEIVRAGVKDFLTPPFESQS